MKMEMISTAVYNTRLIVYSSDSSGEKIEGVAGNWISVENDLETEKEKYNKALMDTIPYYGGFHLQPLDIGNHPTNNAYTTINDNGDFENFKITFELKKILILKY